MVNNLLHGIGKPIKVIALSIAKLWFALILVYFLISKSYLLVRIPADQNINLNKPSVSQTLTFQLLSINDLQNDFKTCFYHVIEFKGHFKLSGRNCFFPKYSFQKVFF